MNGEPARFSYVLPIAAERPVPGTELDDYLRWVASQAELIVVDGSPQWVFAQHHRRWSALARHLEPESKTLVGKVGNVMTGVRAASHDRVVIADDDVRFGPELADLVSRLEQADLVRPQNYFDPLPWHAVWDSGRSLLNRVSGGDWPGTLAVRRSLLLAVGGYAGDVLFENYELAKTVEAAGGRHVLAPELLVRRLPPTARHFLSQRVRQAYDELARPLRFTAFLAVAPAVAALAHRRRWDLLASGTLVVVGAAEAGRRRAGAATRFPLRCSLAAPLWMAERSVCVWGALLARARGGVSYRGRRVRRAASSPRQRRRSVAAGCCAAGAGSLARRSRQS